MRFMTYLFIFLAVTMLLLGQRLRENKEVTDITEYTNRIIWNSTYSDYLFDELENSTYSPSNLRLRNIAYKTADWFGYSSIEFSKLMIEIGYTYPEYNFEFMWNLLRYLVYFWIFTAAFPIMIPLVALIYLITRCVLGWIYKYRGETHGKNLN